jgi:PucR C-terminal helix-turn-helix domain/Purine catabolism regulatory protein-like family/GGDEF-like domain
MASGSESMRLGDLIRTPELGLSVIVGGAPALERDVLGAYITDLPDPSRFVRAGMVVLTSGLWVDRPGGVDRFVDALVGVDAAALVVGLVELGHLPDTVIEACRTKGLVLATISDQVSFGSVVETVQSRLLRGPAAGDLTSRTAAVAGDASAEGLLAFVAEGLGCGVWVLDERGITVLGAAPGPERTAAVLRAAAHAPSGSPILLTAAPESTGWRIELGASDRGGLLVVDRALTSLDADAQQALGIVAGAVRAELRYEARVRIGRRRNVTSLLDAAIDDSVPPGEVSALMRLVGLDPQEPTTVVLGAIDGDPLPPAAGLALLERLVGAGDRRSASTAWRQRLVVLLGGDVDPDALRARVATESTDVAAALAGGRLRLVIGDAATGLTRLGASLLQALDRFGDVQGPGPVVLGEPTTVTGYRTLLRLVGEDQRAGFASAVLSPLIEYDAKHGAELIRTLQAFLDRGGAWQDASRDLHVHPNTLRYRIARIEELTRRDLATMRDRVDLYLALASRA